MSPQPTGLIKSQNNSFYRCSRPTVIYYEFVPKTSHPRILQSYRLRQNIRRKHPEKRKLVFVPWQHPCGSFDSWIIDKKKKLTTVLLPGRVCRTLNRLTFPCFRESKLRSKVKHFEMLTKEREMRQKNLNLFKVLFENGKLDGIIDFCRQESILKVMTFNRV